MFGGGGLLFAVSFCFVLGVVVFSVAVVVVDVGLFENINRKSSILRQN